MLAKPNHMIWENCANYSAVKFTNQSWDKHEQVTISVTLLVKPSTAMVPISQLAEPDRF
jgi:hypothetical protein